MPNVADMPDTNNLPDMMLEGDYTTDIRAGSIRCLTSGRLPPRYGSPCPDGGNEHPFPARNTTQGDRAMDDERTSRVILGERLKEEREYRGFSQDEVARYLGLPPAALSLIESAARDIGPEHLRRLAKLFRIRLESLTVESHDAVDAESFPLPTRAAATLSPIDRDEVRRFAQYLRTTEGPPEDGRASGA